MPINKYKWISNQRNTSQSAHIVACLHITGYHLEYSLPPAIFQRPMEGVLQRIPHKIAYLDILVAGPTKKLHLRNLDKWLSSLKEAGLRQKRSMCSRLATEVQYLGHKMDATGVHPVEAKVKTIVDAYRGQDLLRMAKSSSLKNHNCFL